MTTRLELCQKLSRKTGMDFAGPTTTIGQTGMFLQLVEWIDEAYSYIQSLHRTWQFLHQEFSKALTVGDPSYSANDLGVSTLFGEWNVKDWRIYLNAADEGILDYMEWDDFRLNYQLGTHLTQTGRPFVFSTKPDDTVVFYPIPDQIYTVKGEYWAKNYEMTDDAHEPVWHEDLHLAVLWKALQYYGVEYAEGDKLALGMREFRGYLRKLEKKYLPRMKWGNPLA